MSECIAALVVVGSDLMLSRQQAEEVKHTHTRTHAQKKPFTQLSLMHSHTQKLKLEADPRWLVLDWALTHCGRVGH